MKKRTALAAVAAALLATAVASTGADAAGFRLPEGGAKAMGMAFAFTAQADDPSAIYFNPAGLTQLSGTNFMAGATYVREKGQSFTGSTALDNTVSETQDDLNFYIPNMYLTRRSATTGWAYGIGVFTPFGLGQQYGDRNTSAFRNLTTKIELMTLCVNPTVAYQAGDALSVGFGVDYLWGKAKLSKTAPLAGPINAYNFDLEGDGDAWGYNAGLLLKLTPSLKFGANYRSRFDLKLEGDVGFTRIDNTVDLSPAPGAQTVAAVNFGGATSLSTTGETTLHLPATFAAGFSYNDGPVTFNLDGDWTMWSSYQDLAIRTNGPGAGSTSVTPKRWKNVMAFRMGGEYRVNPALALRAGYAFDPTPVPQDTLSAELPDADRNCYTAGLGYKVGPVTVDAAYFYLQKKDRTVRQTAPGTPGINGKWEGDAHLVSLDLGYRF
jgi:long-chain fatty acid transport protein